MRPALLLVDLQADFLSAPGLEPAAGDVVRGAARLLEAARSDGVPVIHVVTSVAPDGNDRMPHWKALGVWRCVRGTPGHAPPPELAPHGGEAVVAKTYFSAFASRDLDHALAAVRADALVIAGVHLHGCVRATALDAYERGLEVWIAEDAVGSDDPLHAAVTRRYLEGRAARFAPGEAIRQRWAARNASTDSKVPRLPAAVVDGKAVEVENAPEVACASPRCGSQTLFTVAVAGARETGRASAAAKSGGAHWRRIPPAERRRILEAVADRFDAEAPVFARELAIDVGKPVSQAVAEVRRAATLVRRAAALPAPATEPRGSESAARRVPLGVVAAITPWNNPVAIAWGKLAPALALGNAVVWKPAPPATRAALRSLALAAEAGLPDGPVQLVGGDARTAAALMADPGIDAVAFTGSSAAGWSVQEACGRRRLPLQAELGGNNAAVVWSGADLASAAAAIARGAFSFAGQRCTANRRIVVETGLFDELVERLTAETAALVWGDPLDDATEVGPLISPAARDRVRAAVDAAAASAEEVRVPHGAGAPAAGADGAYFPPTLIVGPPHEHPIVQQETFGPVLVVERAGSFSHALDLANGVRQGLAAALFAGPGPWRDAFRESARAGILKWNSSTADADVDAPFGGWKDSGLGPPERGPGDVEFYTRPQALYGGL
jgi:acyl-CoA reductase-like NAD-dependent aldehyde dehydrogenase/nicotinamidase-related amidase